MFQNIVNAVNSAASVVSTAKSVASTVSNYKPLTSAQKARAAAKEASLLGIKWGTHYGNVHDWYPAKPD